MIKIKIIGYGPNPICQITDGLFWYPVDVLATPVSYSSYVAGLFEQWALNPLDANGDPVVIDPNAQGYFFAPGPIPEPPPPEPDITGFAVAIALDPAYGAYMSAMPTVCAHGITGGIATRNLEAIALFWNVAVAAAAPPAELIAFMQATADEYHIPLTFAQNGTVEASQ